MTFVHGYLNWIAACCIHYFFAFSWAQALERLIHIAAIRSVNSDSLTFKTSSEVGNSNKMCKDTFENKAPNTYMVR